MMRGWFLWMSMNTTEIGIHMCGQTLTVTSCHFHRLGQFNYCMEVSGEDIRSAILTTNRAGGLLDRWALRSPLCMLSDDLF